MTKLERIEQDIQRAKSKITEFQDKLKSLETAKTEQENLQIVQLVRAINLTPQELMEFLKKATHGQSAAAVRPAAFAARTQEVRQEIKEEKKDDNENK
jgi:ribosomal protein L12E/L44/L45/RPP1/RPP2